MWWRISIISLALILIGAHFLRFGQPLVCGLFVLAPLLLLIKHKFATQALQLTLIGSALLVWGLSGYDYVQYRVALEIPWHRLSVIMFALVLFTLWAAHCCSGVRARRNRG